MANKHVLLVTFPGQGSLNPSLQFAKRLAKHGVSVTFLTSLSAIRGMSQSSSKSSFNNLIEFLSFSDGYDNGWAPKEAPNFMSANRIHGTKAVEDAIATKRVEGRPYARVIYTLLVPWAGHVAHRLHLPARLLWIQPAIVFGLFYYYFNNYYSDAAARRSKVIQLPGLPAMESSDLLPFFLDSNPNAYDLAILENCKNLDSEDDPTVLMNTFDELESEALKSLNKYKLVAIGPLIPSAFIDGCDPSDTSFGGDLFQKTEDYIPWLNSKEKNSVIYVAFGSLSVLSKQQMEEIAAGLIRTGRPFLWVIRGSDKKGEFDFSCCSKEELEKEGKIVAWCNQVEVLSHPSVGCFFTNCGWNSTLESIVSGVPVVMLPQIGDQPTNAKLVEDFWRTGVRLVKGGNGIVDGDEIRRSVEIVMDGEEMRRQAKKLRDLAKEAMKEDGSSNLNLKIFVDKLGGGNE